MKHFVFERLLAAVWHTRGFSSDAIVVDDDVIGTDDDVNGTDDDVNGTDDVNKDVAGKDGDAGKTSDKLDDDDELRSVMTVDTVMGILTLALVTPLFRATLSLERELILTASPTNGSFPPSAFEKSSI